jgi:DNA-binding SARP family transcriptional activator
MDGFFSGAAAAPVVLVVEEGTVQFAVLGPMEVRDGQVDVTPAAAMLRRVLATLLLHADQVVPIRTFIAELWDDEPPRLARRTVQTYVYQLRKGLAGGPTGAVRRLLETRPHGYRILLEPGELDLRLFEQRAGIGRSALAAGDAHGAATALRDALAVWRGDALTDLVPGPVLSAQAGRLEEARRGVLEQRVEADLRLGLHRELIVELKSLMIRYPRHEEFCAQLMVAAYRCGQRDESLAAYDRLRRLMVEQTGLEPSQRLRKLQHAVLVDAPSLAPPERGAPAAPAEIPPGPEHMLGRMHDLALIDASLRRRPSTPSPGLVMIVGGTGTGKTAAALFAAHGLRERFPDGQLYATLHGDSGRALDPLSVLRGFLRSVSRDEPPNTLEAAARRFRSWTADRRVLIILDDAASAAQVAPLLPNGRGCGTVVTSRRPLPGLPGSAVVRLGPFDDDDGFRLLSLIAGEPRALRDPEAVRELLEQCDHNPLAIRVAAERLAAHPLLSLPELVDRMRSEELRLTELRFGSLDLREQLLAAGRRLDRGERRALRTLSRLASPEFDVIEAMGALAADERSTRAVLNSLLDSFLVVDTGKANDTWPWAGRRFRLPTLLRLAWRTASVVETEPPRPKPRGVPCPNASRPHQTHAVRLPRYSCTARNTACRGQ